MITTDHKILRIEDGVDIWSGHAKTLYLQYEDKGELVVTMNGEVMDLREIWIDRDSYIGGSATITYPYHSATGYPIHCVVDVLVPNPVYNRDTGVFDMREVMRIYHDIR